MHALTLNRRRPSRGQSLVEFALILPVAVLLLGLIATGGQMIITAINVTQAARAAAVAAASDYAKDPSDVSTQTTDASTAANDEEGGASSIKCSGGGVPTGVSPQCVAVTDIAAGTGGLENDQVDLVQVKVYQSITPFIPIFPSLAVSSEATDGVEAVSVS